MRIMIMIQWNMKNSIFLQICIFFVSFYAWEILCSHRISDTLGQTVAESEFVCSTVDA